MTNDRQAHAAHKLLNMIIQLENTNLTPENTTHTCARVLATVQLFNMSTHGCPKLEGKVMAKCV